jgi:hypothetical protein
VSKLWTVDVQVEYRVVVFADSPEEARDLARDNYPDVEPDVYVFEDELRPGDAIPDGWENGEPFSDREDNSIAEALGMDALPDRPTVQRILEWMEAHRRLERCSQTPDMFGVEGSSQATEDRQESERRS